VLVFLINSDSFFLFFDMTLFLEKERCELRNKLCNKFYKKTRVIKTELINGLNQLFSMSFMNCFYSQNSEAYSCKFIRVTTFYI
jgi:hypothetical protein